MSPARGFRLSVVLACCLSAAVAGCKRRHRHDPHLIQPVKDPPPHAAGLNQIRSVPAGLLVAASNGLHRGDAAWTLIQPDIGELLEIAISSDRMEVAATGHGRMLRSHDGGRTFTEESLPEPHAFAAAAFLGRDLFVFSDHGGGYVIHPPHVVEPLDLPDAVTWQVATFAPDGHGYVAGVGRTLLVTTDSGKSWDGRDSPGRVDDLAIYGSALIAATPWGLLRSDDGGRTFRNIYRVARPRRHDDGGCHSLDARDGVLAAGCTGDPPLFTGSFVYSKDGTNFTVAQSDSVPYPTGIAIEPDGRFAGINYHPRLVEGAPEAMRTVYESRKAQWLRLGAGRPASYGVPSVNAGRGGDLPARTPMTPAQRDAFLGQHAPSSVGLEHGTFADAQTRLFENVQLDVYFATTRRYEAIRLENLCLNSPTWRACLDDLGRQAGGQWSYDDLRDAWRLEPRLVSALFAMEVPAGWSASERDSIMEYTSPHASLRVEWPSPHAAPVLDAQEEAAAGTAMGALFAARPWLSEPCKQYEPGDQGFVDTAKAQVDGVPALLLEMRACDEALLRQWQFVKDGWRYTLFGRVDSAGGPDGVKQLDAAVATFRVKRQP
jgi:hypothetical protein